MTSSTRKIGLTRRQLNARVAAAGAVAATGLAPVVAQAQDKVEVRMATYTVSETWDATIQALFDEFNAQSTLATVNIEFRPGDQYWDKLQTEFAGGTAPDIALLNMDWVVPGAARGMFTDLAPLFERDQIDLSRYWYPHDREWGWKGGIYGGLLYAGGDAIYVNKDLLAAAGLEMPDPVWTWDDLVDYGRALTDESTNQLGIYIASIAPPFTGANFIHGAGGTVLNDTYDTCTLNTPEARAGLQFLADLILKEEVMVPPDAVEGQTNPFMSGKVGVYFGGTWDEIQIRAAGFEWDFAHMPAHPTTGLRAVSTDSNAWGIMSSTSNQDAAWEVVKFLIDKEAQTRLMTLGIPVLSEVIESPDFVAAHAPQAIEVVTSDFAEVGHDIYPTPDASEWWEAVRQELSVIWSGEATVEEATQRATDRVNEIFARRPPEWDE